MYKLKCIIKGDGKPLTCCNPDGSAPTVLPKGCLKITTPKDDPDSKNRCLSTQRGSDTADIGCQIKPVRKVCIFHYCELMVQYYIIILCVTLKILCAIQTTSVFYFNTFLFNHT